MATRKGAMNSASGFKECLLRDKSWNPFKVSLIESSNDDPHETEASSLIICNGGFLEHSECVSPGMHGLLLCIVSPPRNTRIQTFPMESPLKMFAESPHTVAPKKIHLSSLSAAVIV